MGSKVVLVIDDEREICELISDEIRAEGFEVLVAYSGHEAIKIINDRKPNLVISDFMMPNGTGLDVLEAINKLDPDERPIFVMVTGYANISKETALQKGATDVYSKPVDFDVFFQSIFKLLR